MHLQKRIRKILGNLSLNNTKSFKDNGYLIIPKILSGELLDFIGIHAYNIARIYGCEGTENAQVPNTPQSYGDYVIENLSDFLLPKIESAAGMKLLPTYTLFRVYKAGDILPKHIDRPSCEISISLSLRKKGNIWPIYVNNTDYKTRKSDKVEFTLFDNFLGLNLEEVLEDMHQEHRDTTSILLDEGDAVLYRGCELVHWRESYNEGTKQAQVFLHYVDANGPYTEWKNDKSPWKYFAQDK